MNTPLEHLHSEWNSIIVKWLVKAADGRRRKKASNDFRKEKQYLIYKFVDRNKFDINIY